jgi:regulator of PEP synthase PpsR (kinase-PPPase family)
MEFTIQHDDGQTVEDLAAADLVLVGASRTSKTPVSFYLAYRGWKVANVPLVLGIAPPETLRGLDSGRVVGLTIEAERLALIRQTRVKHLRLEDGSCYTDVEHIREELRYTLNLCKTHRWPVVDVTGKAVEETAEKIMSLVRPHGSEIDKQI